MSRVCRRFSKGADRHDDPQPSVCAFSVAFLAHPFDHLSRHCRGLVAMLGNPLMGGTVDVEIGDGHGATVARGLPLWKVSAERCLVAGRLGIAELGAPLPTILAGAFWLWRVPVGAIIGHGPPYRRARIQRRGARKRTGKSGFVGHGPMVAWGELSVP